MGIVRRFHVLLGVLLAVFTLLIPSTARGQRDSRSSSYSQSDRARSLSRDVSFLRPTEVTPSSTGTSVNLRVVEAINRFNGIDLRHRSYNGGLVGPTIRVQPGHTLHVHLQNDLTVESASAHDGNVPHGFNITNLHTHGLHVSPQAPADDVFLEIGPQHDFRFVFAIPDQHPAGTFWYHAHRHGSTALQLTSGMSGALIVSGGLDDIPEIRAAEEKILVLQQFVYKENDGEAAFVDPDLLYSQEGDIVTAINGEVTPTIVMRPGEVQRWRIIHAGTTEAIFLDAEGVHFFEIAVDGLATGRMEEKNSIHLYPGYRSDVLVKAPLHETTDLVFTAIRNPERSIRKRREARQNVLRIVVEGSPNDMPLPAVEALAAVAPFSDRDVPSDDEVASRKRELRFKEVDNKFLINGREFDPNNIEQMIDLNSAEEWTLIAENGVHPFHMHVNPFAVKPAGENLPWVWRDTVAVTRQSPVTIRIRFRQFDGKTVLHCHNLIHEDRGMMQAIEIVNRQVLANRETRRQAPVWSATDRAGRRMSSRDIEGQLYMLVFHRGISCLHCAQQLTALKTEYATLQNAGIRLVTICPELPSDAASLAELNQFPFPILRDPDLAAFRDFACLDPSGEVQHAIFLIDRQRDVVLEHRTETAVADPVSVVLQVLKAQSTGRQK